MGFLKKLFNAKLNKLAVDKGSKGQAEFVPERLKEIRSEILAELKAVEISLLMKPEQVDGDLFRSEYSEKGRPFV